MNKEIWKPIIGYEGTYEVSSLGRVKSVGRTVQGGNQSGPCLMKKTEKIMAQYTTRGGYKVVRFKKAGKYKEFYVHRLVAIAFIDTAADHKVEVNHIDGDKTNNAVTNLEWVTHQKNITHLWNVLGRGKRERRAVKCVCTGEVFQSAASAVKKYGGTQSGLWYSLNRGSGFYRGKQYAYTK